MREIIVTSALPYANGPIHLGHLLEYIQTDIWARFQRLCGHHCHYICADDAHGSPIMIKARNDNITPQELISLSYQEHTRDFDGFLISFDNYYSTHSDENREFSNLIYQRLCDAGLILTRTITQAYDDSAKMFLPDRFIRGDCPRCHTSNQYGDCCEACGATYQALELNNAVSILSGKPPVEKESEHYFFDLKHFEEHLKQWLKNKNIQPAIRNKLEEWFAIGLRDWDISRDEPYFGFEIPDHPGKYFYVWLDAPIGYMASFKNYCKKKDLDFNHYWKADSTTELHHFIGKDIAYFHILFWPAMLEGANFRRPSSVHCHGFVTINKQKMSKSRGTYITAHTYLQHLSPEYLRYYFATKLGSGIEDIDLNFDDFTQRVNSDLVGKVVNIASRCGSFIHKYFDDNLLCSAQTLSHPLLQQTKAAKINIATAYENREYALAMREIMCLADNANQYIEQNKPWQIAKHEADSNQLHEICSIALMLFAHLILFLKPVLPHLSEQVENFLNISFNQWEANLFTNTTHRIRPFKPLLRRIEKEAIEKIIQASKETIV